MIWAVMFALLPPCPMEDSADCAWDAGNSGNGIGTSFFDVAGTTYYPDGEVVR
jgi:hypothetical protein